MLDISVFGDSFLKGVIYENNTQLRKDVSIIGKGRRYDQEYKDMIVELFKSGMSLAEHRLRIWHCKINN